jgi:hypothetical protein
MRKSVLLGLGFLIPALAAPGERALFNGKNVDGWEMIRSEGRDTFVVEDGVLRTTGAKGMIAYTREKLGNGALRVVYKMSNEKGNSGIFIRIPDVPKAERDAIHRGIEVQIDNNDNDWHSTGVLYSMTKALARPYKPAGEWNTMEITLDGLRTMVRLNGVLVTDYDGVSEVPPKKLSYEPDRGPRPETGYIGLQGHDDRAIIYFKEVSFASKK